jgi:hypothetical protein
MPSFPLSIGDGGPIVHRLARHLFLTDEPDRAVSFPKHLLRAMTPEILLSRFLLRAGQLSTKQAACRV